MVAMSLERILFANLFLAGLVLNFGHASQVEMNNWLVNKNHVSSFKTEGSIIALKHEPQKSEACYNAMYLGLAGSSRDDYWEFTCTGGCKIKVGISKRTDFADYDQIKGIFFNGTTVEDYVYRSDPLPAKGGKAIRSNDRIGFILNLQKSKFFISQNERPIGTLRLYPAYSSLSEKIHPTIIFCSSGTVEIREVKPIFDIIGRR